MPLSTETILPSFFKLRPQPCNCSAFKAIWSVATETCCALQKLMILKGNTRLRAHASLRLSLQFANGVYLTLLQVNVLEKCGGNGRTLVYVDGVLFSLKAAGLHLLCGFHTE